MADIRCAYCGRRMEKGVSYLGFGLNSLSYSCKCGCVASFLKNTIHQIESVEHHVEYKDGDTIGKS